MLGVRWNSPMQCNEGMQWCNALVQCMELVKCNSLQCSISCWRCWVKEWEREMGGVFIRSSRSSRFDSWKDPEFAKFSTNILENIVNRSNNLSHPSLGRAILLRVETESLQVFFKFWILFLNVFRVSYSIPVSTRLLILACRWNGWSWRYWQLAIKIK